MGGYKYEIVPGWSLAAGNPYGCVSARDALELLSALGCYDDEDTTIHARNPETGATVDLPLCELERLATLDK